MIGQAQRIIWPGGEHEFCFAIGELRALEQQCDAGCMVIFKRLAEGQFKVDDVIATIRLGLRGAGMSERDAMALIDRTLAGEANLYELSTTAARVLAMFIAWPTDKGEDQPGKADAATTGKMSEGLSGMGGPAGPTTSPPLQ